MLYSNTHRVHMYIEINTVSNTYPRLLTLLNDSASALPSCLQAVFAFSIVKSSCKQTVPQTLLMNISNLPNGGF